MVGSTVGSPENQAEDGQEMSAASAAQSWDSGDPTVEPTIRPAHQPSFTLTSFPPGDPTVEPTIRPAHQPSFTSTCFPPGKMENLDKESASKRDSLDPRSSTTISSDVDISDEEAFEKILDDDPDQAFKLVLEKTMQFEKRRSQKNASKNNFLIQQAVGFDDLPPSSTQPKAHNADDMQLCALSQINLQQHENSSLHMYINQRGFQFNSDSDISSVHEFDKEECAAPIFSEYDEEESKPVVFTLIEEGKASSEMINLKETEENNNKERDPGTSNPLEAEDPKYFCCDKTYGVDVDAHHDDEDHDSGTESQVLDMNDYFQVKHVFEQLQRGSEEDSETRPSSSWQSFMSTQIQQNDGGSEKIASKNANNAS